MTAAAFGRVSAQGALSNSSGIVSVVRRSRGTYRVTMTEEFSSPDYQVVPLVEDTGRNIPPYAEIDQRTLSTFDIQWRNSSNVLNDYDFTFTIYTSEITKGDKGDPGTPGRDSNVPGPPGPAGSDASVTSANIIRAVQGTPTDDQIIQYDAANSRLEFQDPPAGGGASITPVPYITGDPHYWVNNGDGRIVTLILHDIDITDANRATDQLLVSISGNPFRVNPWPIATGPRRINVELSDAQANNITSNFGPQNDSVTVNVELRQGASTTLQTISVNLPIITAGKAIALKEDITSSGGGTTVVANPSVDSSDPALSSVTIGSTDYRVVGQKGDTGAAGRDGSDGRDGTDATVNATNMINAVSGQAASGRVMTWTDRATLTWADQSGGGGGGGTTVAANPSVDGNDPALNSITIGSTDYRVVGQKGDKGDPGAASTVAGPAGPAGSDASVTIANIISAIGGSPTDEQVLTYESTGPTLEWQDPPMGGTSQPAPVGVNQVIVPGTLSSEQSVASDGTLTISASTVNAGPYCSMGTGDDTGKLVFSRNGILRIGIGITCRIGSANGRCNPGITVAGTGIQVLGRSNGYYRATNTNKQIFRSLDLLVTANAVGTIQIINPSEAFSNATLLVSSLSHIVMFAYGGTAGSDASVTSANIVRAVHGTPTDDQIIQYDASNSRLEFADAPSGGGSNVTPVPYITGDPHYWVNNGNGRIVTLILHDVDITPTNTTTDQLLITIGGNPFTVAWPIATAPRRINVEVSDTQADNITSNATRGTVDINVRLRRGTTTLQSINPTTLPVIAEGKAIALKEDIPDEGGGSSTVIGIDLAKTKAYGVIESGPYLLDRILTSDTTIRNGYFNRNPISMKAVNGIPFALIQTDQLSSDGSTVVRTHWIQPILSRILPSGFDARPYPLPLFKDIRAFCFFSGTSTATPCVIAQKSNTDPSMGFSVYFVSRPRANPTFERTDLGDEFKTGTIHDMDMAGFRLNRSGESFTRLYILHKEAGGTTKLKRVNISRGVGTRNMAGDITLPSQSNKYLSGSSVSTNFTKMSIDRDELNTGNFVQNSHGIWLYDEATDHLIRIEQSFSDGSLVFPTIDAGESIKQIINLGQGGATGDTYSSEGLRLLKETSQSIRAFCSDSNSNREGLQDGLWVSVQQFWRHAGHSPDLLYKVRADVASKIITSDGKSLKVSF